jgi:hypothetical protein
VRALLAKPLPPETLEVLAATILIACRAWMLPVAGLWHDWVVVLCVYWIFTAAASRTKAWPYVTGAVMAGLLVLYAVGHFPLALGALGFVR